MSEPETETHRPCQAPVGGKGRGAVFCLTAIHFMPIGKAWARKTRSSWRMPEKGAVKTTCRTVLARQLGWLAQATSEIRHPASRKREKAFLTKCPIGIFKLLKTIPPIHVRNRRFAEPRGHFFAGQQKRVERTIFRRQNGIKHASRTALADTTILSGLVCAIK